ncbi:hypothetical protein JB92DRAFT_3134325 [Gautieria morchelliformis]|nr:hypothetical protein JB92DRAFT_3134325 [Gautieria morchelliformis]
MHEVLGFFRDKSSSKRRGRHKELSPLANTPAVVSSIDRSNQVSPSPSGLELDRPNLLPPPSAREIGFPSQSPSPCTSDTEHPTESLHPQPRANHFRELVTPVNPPTASGESGKVARAALKKVLSALSDTSGMFPPLKTVAAGMLNILTTVDTHLQNKQGFQDLAQKLEVLISIIKDYEVCHLGPLLAPRIRDLSEAIQACVDDIKRRAEKSRFRRVVEVDDDARFIVGTFGKISLLLDVFEMDTLVHMDANVAQLLQDDVFRSLKSADDVSYKSHRGRGSEFAGCMEDTRVNVLDDLETWADDDTAPNVCWLGGMAGIGKSSVAVTFSERMDKKLKLGASFFCSMS